MRSILHGGTEWQDESCKIFIQREEREEFAWNSGVLMSNGWVLRYHVGVFGDDFRIQIGDLKDIDLRKLGQLKTSVIFIHTGIPRRSRLPVHCGYSSWLALQSLRTGYELTSLRASSYSWMSIVSYNSSI